MHLRGSLSGIAAQLVSFQPKLRCRKNARRPFANLKQMTNIFAPIFNLKILLLPRRSEEDEGEY